MKIFYDYNKHLKLTTAIKRQLQYKTLPLIKKSIIFILLSFYTMIIEFIEDRQQRKLILTKADILSQQETTTTAPEGDEEQYCLPDNFQMLVLVPYASLWIIGIISYASYRSYYG